MKLQLDPCHSWDKLGLFVVAGMVVTVLGGIVAGTFMGSGVPDKGDVLLGGLATGLILFLRDLVTAIRASWEEITRGETLKTLGSAAPSDHAPPPAGVEEAADQVAEAAADEADAIAGTAVSKSKRKV